MDVTKRLMEKDSTLSLHTEGKWHTNVVDKQGYRSFNDAGVEVETGELLYSLTRILKPQRVLETGTHWGIGASYIGQALKDNNQGMLDTLEFNHENFLKALRRIQTLDLEDHVNVLEIDVLKFKTREQYQLILLDTEPDLRFGELVRYYGNLAEGGYVFIHDLHRHMGQEDNQEHGFGWPFGVLPDQIKQWVKYDKLRPFHFPTPRGLCGFYKPTTKDYKWT